MSDCKIPTINKVYFDYLQELTLKEKDPIVKACLESSLENYSGECYIPLSVNEAQLDELVDKTDGIKDDTYVNQHISSVKEEAKEYHKDINKYENFEPYPYKELLMKYLIEQKVAYDLSKIYKKIYNELKYSNGKIQEMNERFEEKEEELRKLKNQIRNIL